MYAAPVWEHALSSSSERVRRSLRRIQRSIAIRVVAGYRTSSFDAATLIARMPPWTLEANLRRRVYDRGRDLRRRGVWTKEEDDAIRREEQLLLVRQWSALLNCPGAWGRVTILAIELHLVGGLARKHGELNYFGAQMLSRHGSFGHFLWRIGKRESAKCNHCSVEDTVEHTLKMCPAWSDDRNTLAVDLDIQIDRLTLERVVETMLRNRANWISFITFATAVRRRENVPSLVPPDTR